MVIERVHADHALEVGKRLAVLLHLVQLPAARNDRGPHLGVAQDVPHVGFGGIRRNDHVDQTRGKAREIHDCQLQPVL
jgi:hypothetical protein